MWNIVCINYTSCTWPSFEMMQEIGFEASEHVPSSIIPNLFVNLEDRQPPMAVISETLQEPTKTYPGIKQDSDVPTCILAQLSQQSLPQLRYQHKSPTKLENIPEDILARLHTYTDLHIQIKGQQKRWQYNYTIQFMREMQSRYCELVHTIIIMSKIFKISNRVGAKNRNNNWLENSSSWYGHLLQREALIQQFLNSLWFTTALHHDRLNHFTIGCRKEVAQAIQSFTWVKGERNKQHNQQYTQSMIHGMIRVYNITMSCI